jgi:BirA family biotin operon repressor/biotin-[acetyl-CoA-carboxylase] ligase
MHIQKVLFYDEITSTNDYALLLEKEGEASGTVIIARRQKRGRGRLKRSWYMREGDIAMSVLLRLESVKLKHISLMPWAMGLAVVDALGLLDIKAFLKWPNDIVIKSDAFNNYCGGYEKVGGILIENIIKNQQVSALIIGLGINIKAHTTLKAHIAHINWLTSIKPDLKADTIMPLLLEKIDYNIDQLTKVDGDLYAHSRYREHCISLGHKVSVQQGGDRVQGEVTGFSADGFLIIRSDNINHIIYSGDIVY